MNLLKTTKKWLMKSIALPLAVGYYIWNIIPKIRYRKLPYSIKKNKWIVSYLRTRKKVSKFFRLPYVNVHTVDEFFQKPKHEREKRIFGISWYLHPIALPWEEFDSKEKGWNLWSKLIWKEYPIQGFVREYLLTTDFPPHSFWNCIKHQMYDYEVSIRCFVKPNLPKLHKALPRHVYHDAADVYVEMNLALLCDFYDEAKNELPKRWELNDKTEFYDKLKEYATWIEIGRITLDQDIKREMDIAYSKRKLDDLSYEDIYGRVNSLEDQKRQKQIEILKWMTDNFENFWT